MGHKHSVLDKDTFFKIDTITRAITTDSEKLHVMQFDHNSERLTFEMPRYIEGHDMSVCNKVEAHFMNIDAKTKDVVSGHRELEDFRVMEGDENTVIVSWLITKGSTKLGGNLNFLLNFRCVEDGIETYSWHTDFFTNYKVKGGMDAAELFEAEYVDVIEQWKASVMEHFKNGLDTWKTEKTEEMYKSIDRKIAAYSTDWNRQIAVERARIDQFVALEDGSTTGDAELLDARVDAHGVIHKNVGEAMRTHQERVLDAEDLFKNDGCYNLKGGFEHGKIDNTGAEFTGTYRVRSSGTIQYDRDIVIAPSDGFRYSLHFYTNDGSYSKESGWLSGACTITKGTLFRVVIARVEEDTEEVANINEFVRALTITTALSEVIKKVETVRLSLEAHSESNTHLKSIINSNNLVNPEEIVTGGYYAHNTGKWVARADISTTGLIPCEKGRTYYCGIDFNNVRGGNCTFWNSGGQYVSGIDVANCSVGFEIPDNEEIKYFRVSFYTAEKALFHVNMGEYKEFDEYSSAYLFDKEVFTPTFKSSEKENTLHHINTYKDDVTVLHKRNDVVGTSYKVVIVNKTKFDGTETRIKVLGTSATSLLGDGNNTNVQSYAKIKECLHMINGGIYLVASGEADGITIIDGKILKSTGVEQFDKEQYVLGIDEDGGLKAYLNETAQNILSDGSVYALTGFVPLVQDGVDVDKTVLAVCPHYDVRHPRQVVGTLSSGDYFTFCCDGRVDGENGMTLQECIDTITKDLDISFAFNLDGGGSTQSAVGKKQINRSIDGRSIPNVIMFE